MDFRDDVEPAPALAGVLHDRDGDRPDEHVLLRAGVLPGRLLQLPDQGVEEALEPVEVGGREVHHERIGRDEAVDAQPPLEVHLPGEAATDLDRVELTPKRLGESAVDHALEAPFELLESHAGVSLPGSTPWLGVGSPRPAGPGAVSPRCRRTGVWSAAGERVDSNFR